MQIANKKIVTIDYTLTDKDGDVLDTSKGRGPLKYLHGSGNIIPGLENALTGKSAGDELKVTVPPEDGYGERDEELVQSVPRKNFPDDQVEVGMQFEAEGDDGAHVVTVVAMDKESVTVDANHPLAGSTLSFEVKILEVRDATADEMKHGHVHGPGGAHE